MPAVGIFSERSETFNREMYAQMASRVLTSPEYVDKLVRADRTLAEKIKNRISDVAETLRSVTSKDIEVRKQLRRATKAQGLFERALESVTSTNDEKMHVSENNSYSLNQFEDGQKFVNIETDQARFDGLTQKEKTDLATKIIKERFQGKVIGIENRAFVNGVTADEYTHPAKHVESDIYDAKMRASSELDNLMDAGYNFRNSQDGRDGHVHNDADGGFDYYDVIFKVGDDYYRGVINIKNNSKGKLLKDITKIENITQDMTSQYGENPTYAFLRDASMDSIPQNLKMSTPKSDFSMENVSEEAVRSADVANQQASGDLGERSEVVRAMLREPRVQLTEAQRAKAARNPN